MKINMVKIIKKSSNFLIRYFNLNFIYEKNINAYENAIEKRKKDYHDCTGYI